MSIYSKIQEDAVFAESTIINDGIQLKNPKPIREAFVIEQLRKNGKKALQEYVKSPHAKALLEHEIISPDSLECLTKDAFGPRSMELMVCHMAHENGDDRWDELVRLRAEERRIMNDLIRDYSTPAGVACKHYHSEVDKYVPREYQNL